MSPNPSVEEVGGRLESADINPNMNQDKNEYVWRYSDDLAKFAKKHLNEEPSIRETCLVKMRAWVNRQSKYANCRTDNIFLLRFLRARKFDLEKACDNLEKYLSMRSSNPEWFTQIDPTIPNVEELSKTGFSVVLPERDNDRRRVLLNYIDKVDVTKHINSDVMKVNMAAIETLMEDEVNQIRGITYIFYCKDISLTHCSIWTPADAHKLFGSCEKGVAVRHSDINLIRLPFCLWAVVEFVKQLLSNKIKSRINLLSTEDKAVKKFGASRLPPEIGGTGESLEVMAENWFRVLQENKSRLMAMDDFILDLRSNPETIEEEVEEIEKKVAASSGFWSLIPGM